jgi:hypothetical protein
VDNGRQPDDELGEAWDPDDDSGEEAWDDGSRELWDEATTEPEPESEYQAETEYATETGYEQPDEYGPHTALPSKVEAWRRRSATGAILTGFAFGLQEVFEPKQGDPSIVMETSGDPPRDLPVEADLEYGRPRHSVVNIRPWLLPGDQQESPETGAAGGGEQTASSEQASPHEEPEA